MGAFPKLELRWQRLEVLAETARIILRVDHLEIVAFRGVTPEA